MPRKNSAFDLGTAINDVLGQVSSGKTPSTDSPPPGTPVEAVPVSRSRGSGRLVEPPKSSSIPRLYLAGVVALLLLITLFKSFVLVGAGERAVVFNRFTGTQPGQLGEGLHLLLPWVQSTSIYDVKSQTYTMSDSTTESNSSAGNANDALEALTRDGLPVMLEMSVRFHPDPERVSKLHQTIGPDYVEKVVRPQARSHVRMIVAQYPVVDVYGPRRALMINQINARLRNAFGSSDIVLDEALLRDVRFSTAFQAAIEQKQVAQQDVSRMEFVLQSADKERRQKIIVAQGEAESIRLKANALARNPGLTQYEYVQNLPSDARTIVADGRTIVNLGSDASAGAVAAEEPQRQRPATSGGSQ